jgi:hypothetical protein
MSTNVTPKPDSQLWGIYHTDREHARELGDPLHAVIEAPNNSPPRKLPLDLALMFRGRIRSLPKK